MGAPRVCFIDIETAPIKGYAWGMFETNLVHVIEPTYILCYAIKWQGEKKITTRALPDYPGYAKNKKSDKALCGDLWKDLSEASVIIAHNGDSFDLKKIKSRLLVNGYPPPSPFKTIDTLKISRREFTTSGAIRSWGASFRIPAWICGLAAWTATSLSRGG
jgi:uncharacterized protein YprB with RNaseH-like and TPR domain